MSVSQTTFRTALLRPETDVPKGLIDSRNLPAGNRFSVYRNNVIFSLTEALQTAFPLIYRLIGATAFSKLAAIYVRKHPPTSPVMMFYGGGLPGFLETFQPLAHIGYLPDCARLDLAMRHSYHAKDASPIDPSAFQSDPETLMSLRLSLAPATVILRSKWPLYDIWRVNFEEGAPAPQPTAQDVLITRPEFDPMTTLLPPGAADWFGALQNGISFGGAHEKATQTDPAFDLATALSQALHTGALIKFTAKDT